MDINLVMAIHPITNGVQHHRMLVPSVMLGQNGFNIKTVPDLARCPLPLAVQADAIIVSRLLSEFPEQQPKIIESLKGTNTKLVVDLDDHWLLPKGHPNFDSWQKSNTADCIRETLQLADMVWCTNPALETAIGNISNAQVHVVPNGISEYDTQWKTVGNKRPFSEFMIGVSAAPNHYPDLKLLRKPLQELRKQRGWRIVAMGAHPSQQNTIIDLLQTDRIVFEQHMPSTEYAQMYDGIDLMLAPLQHSTFNKYRSDLKIAEACHSKTPIMVENFGPYAKHKCAVKNWDSLVDVVLNQLTGDRTLLEKYRVYDKAYYSTTTPDQTRIETLTALCETKMQIVK